MTSMPEFFKSPVTGNRLVLAQSGLKPYVSGDLSLYTPDVDKLRPLVDPHMIAFDDQNRSWQLSYLDPATSLRVEVERTADFSITLDGLELKNLVPSPETLISDSRYMALCQFILFHGWVADLQQPITVVTGMNTQGVMATLGGDRWITALEQKRYPSGSLQFLFQGIGGLYLPSVRAKVDDSERVPQLDDHPITPLPCEQADVSHLPHSLRTWCDF